MLLRFSESSQLIIKSFVYPSRDCPTITILEDVYRILMSIKGTKERFSNFFERMVISRRNSEKLKELRGFVGVKNKDALLKGLSEKREEIRY